MKLRPRLVYFDNNAIANLYEPRQGRSASMLEDWRAQLVFRVRNGAVIIVVSLDALEEYAPVMRSAPSRYVATLDYLQWHVRAPLIAPPNLLLDREFKHGRRLLANELGFDQDTTDKLWGLVRSRRAVDHVVQTTIAEKERYRVGMRAFIDSLKVEYEKQIAQLGDLAKHAPTLAAQARRTSRLEFDNLAEIFSARVRDTIIQSGRAPPEAAGWPLSWLPSLCNYVRYNLGRTVRNAAGASVKPSDANDHDHYVTARYTDMLLTDDGEFRETCALVDPSFDVRGFDEFFAKRCSPVVTFEPG